MYWAITTNYSLEVKVSNLSDYSDVFQSAWVGLRKQREDYEKRMSTLEKYKGSKGYDKDVAEAEKTYRDNVKSIQDDTRDKINQVLRRMREKVAPVKMDVPTDEQIRVLQMLSMREHLTNSDIQLAAENLRSSDSAMATLADIALRSGCVIPTSYKSAEEQRRDALDALTSAATGLVFWNGADSDTVRSEWSYNRSPYNPDADRSKLNPHTWETARVAELGGADMQGMTYKRTPYDICSKLVGDDVPWDAVQGLA